MHIVQINFERPNVNPAMMASFDNPDRARKFVGLPGLQWKIWLRGEGEPKFGGIYCFDSRAAAEAYLAGPIVASLKGDPEVANFSAQIFGIAEQPSRVTNAPLPFPAQAAE
jgi:Putative mono-oxygenase ydhR